MEKKNQVLLPSPEKQVTKGTPADFQFWGQRSPCVVIWKGKTLPSYTSVNVHAIKKEIWKN